MKSTVVGAALALTLLAGCAGPASAPTAKLSPTPTLSPYLPSASPTRTEVPTDGPAPTATSGFPAVVEIEPSAVIDVPGGGFISVTSDGTTVWAGVDGSLLRIDSATNSVQTLDAPLARDDTTLTMANDGLWATRWAGGRLYRLDPATGEVLLNVAMPTAVRVAFVGDDLWVGQEGPGSMTDVDRVTGELGSKVVSQGAYGNSGLGDLWFTAGSPLAVVRVDPATGIEKARIKVPGETNCTLYGSFPDNVWTACFGGDVVARSAARVDPVTNSLAAVTALPPSHGGSVVVIDGQPWFVGSFDGADGQPFAGLLRIDPLTGRLDRFFSIAGADCDPGVVAGNALWLPDEAGNRILRIDLADLESDV